MEKFNYTQDENPEQLISLVSELYKTEKERDYTENKIFFDTFDWRLYKKNLSLTKIGSSFTLSALSGVRSPLTEKSAIKKKYIYWWDLPDGRLKDGIKNIIGIRSLIPVAATKNNNLVFKLLNKDEKIVLRIIFQDLQEHSVPDKKIRLVYLDSVRGYSNERNRVRKLLTEQGLKQTRKDLITIALQNSDITPGSYTGKLNIKLKPEMTAQQAAVMIFGDLLNTIKLNEDGIIKDIDSEFLHDFRVSVRRTRAALSQIKDVFSGEVIMKAKKDFASLGKRTNLLRDLDVYLLKQAGYKKLLPLELQPGLEPVFSKLREERKEEQKKLSRFLRTRDYKNIITDWGELLESPDKENIKSRNSDVPAIDLAKKFISKKYKQIISAGSLINDDTPDPELHSLRIECKKLRYLLEFFSTLFPEKEMGIIIGQLKKLQDNLGDFNDLYVQQQSLKEFLDKKAGKKNIQETMAVGGLISVLYQKQHQVRIEFSKKFDEFSKKGNTKLYKKLFS